MPTSAPPTPPGHGKGPQTTLYHFLHRCVRWPFSYSDPTGREEQSPSFVAGHCSLITWPLSLSFHLSEMEVCLFFPLSPALQDSELALRKGLGELDMPEARLEEEEILCFS